MARLARPPATIAIALPVGTSVLPVVELTPAQVRGKRLRLTGKRREKADTSFGDSTSSMRIEALPLFHAAVKTELASKFTSGEAMRGAFAFAEMYGKKFVWKSDNFRIAKDPSFSLEDFAQHGLAARVGEAVAYLKMLDLGYRYWDRCDVVWKRAAEALGANHPGRLRSAAYIKARVRSGKPDVEPDFIFEKATREVALMEAKGSFVSPEKDKPTTKPDLKHGLDQLDAWANVIRPKPKKSYAIGTYLRQVGDQADPSFTALVDPPSEGDPDAPVVDLPPDVIRKCNYGAWLGGMGLRAFAGALRVAPKTTTYEYVLPVVEKRGRRFLVVVLGVSRNKRTLFGASRDVWGLPFALSSQHWWEWQHRAWKRVRQHDQALVMGLELGTLRIVEEVLQNPDSDALVTHGDLYEDAESALKYDSPDFSVFPDGTCFGLVDRDAFSTDENLVQRVSLYP